MLRVVLSVSVLSVLLSVPVVARADEQLLNLFPKQRAAHQEKMDANAQKYEARGHDYVEHLYADGSETPMSEMDDLDSLDSSETTPVDAGEVAKIIQGVPKFPD